jgi:hypothetical protein
MAWESSTKTAIFSHTPDELHDEADRIDWAKELGLPERPDDTMPHTPEQLAGDYASLQPEQPVEPDPHDFEWGSTSGQWYYTHPPVQGNLGQSFVEFYQNHRLAGRPGAIFEIAHDYLMDPSRRRWEHLVLIDNHTG